MTTARTPGTLRASDASIDLIVAWAYGLRDVEPEHPRQDDVLDVFAPAADEPRVFLALDRMAHAPDFRGGLWLHFGGHQATPSVVSAATTGADSAADSVPAACWMALTMFT